ncbi:hypothetical protein NDN08_001326 [Rhodosorus marinus]|uniref:Calmodulin-lysine N-methyltransferase n=1 Tax=Rhodosorus marinus TaxID=101924 RepID=A0AAV8UWA5_9RHOD|nr:hypothetical protein NDN08_001326 [Rhodosorus marinus]
MSCPEEELERDLYYVGQPEILSDEPISKSFRTELLGSPVAVRCDAKTFGVAGEFWQLNWLITSSLLKTCGFVSLRGLNVLELGAGTGALSVAMAKLGAHACATDLPELFPLFQENSQANGFQVQTEGAHVSCQNRGRVMFGSLRWGVDTLPQETFQLILGCELLYWGGWSLFDEDPQPGLIQVLASECAKGSVAILVGCSREPKREQHFFEQMAAKGVHVRFISPPERTNGDVFVAELSIGKYGTSHCMRQG